MSNKTLLLTPSYQPAKVIHWHDAVKLRWENVVDVVAEYEEDVCSPSVKWKMPAVVRLKNLPKIPKPQVKFSRHALYDRDKWFCMYCGSDRFPVSELTIDHVVPRSKGGKTTWTNCTTACKKCNSKKGDKLCEEIGMYPLIKPVKPKSAPYYKPTFDEINIPVEWEPYLQ